MRSIFVDVVRRATAAGVGKLRDYAKRRWAPPDAAEISKAAASAREPIPLELAFAKRRAALVRVREAAQNGWLAEEASAFSIYDTYRDERAIRLDLRNAMALAVAAQIRSLEAQFPKAPPAPVALPVRRPIKASPLSIILSKRRAS